MVQVDVFWSYAIGASLAAGAARQLKDEEEPFQNKYFTYTLLYISILFAPSGIYLLWNFPHWETMQVATTWGDLPAWLVAGFAITNITQGILGFYIAYLFIRKGKFLAAHFQWFLGYFFMFFILVHGWDSLGWQRFLYDPTMHEGTLWSPGVHDGLLFLKSNVCLTLLGMGVLIVPCLIYPIAKWIIEGAKEDKSISPDMIPKSVISLFISLLTVVFVAALGSAGAAGLMAYFIGQIAGNTYVGVAVGIPAFLLLAKFFLFQKPMPGYQLFQKLIIGDEPA